MSCEALSSAEIYNTLCSFDKMPETSVKSVDLPMPGSPPSKTMEAGTMPPPSTRSNSSTPVLILLNFSSRTELKGCGLTMLFRMGFSAAAGACTSSIKEFHAPQFGHLPSHLGLTAPHSPQTYVVTVFAMML